MFSVLTRLWRWCQRWFLRRPPKPPVSVAPPHPTLSDLDYENCLMALLAEAEQGNSWGYLQGSLISRRVSAAKLAQWLRSFSPRWLAQPELHQALAQRLLLLGRVATGELATVARAVGTQLQVSAVSPPSPSQPTPVPFDGVPPIVENPDSNEDALNVEELLQQGGGHYQAGNYEAALASFEQAIKLKPDYYNTWFNRGIALYDLGRHEEAIASHEQAIKLKPDYYQAWFNRGNALSALGRHEEAIASYEQALKLKPDFDNAWVNRGNALYALGRHEEAIASFEQAIKLQPDDYLAWVNRGSALYALGRHEEAIASYEQAIKLQPDDYQAWSNRGNALKALERHEEAIASHEQAIKLNPDDYRIWVNRGVAASASDSYDPSCHRQFTHRFQVSCARIPQHVQFQTFTAAEAQAHLQASWQTSQPLLLEAFNPRESLPALQRPLPPEVAQLLQQPPPPSLFEMLRQPPSSEVLDRIHQDSLYHPLLTNPQLQQRGYPGEIASYQAELDRAIGRDTHPEGWGILHHRIGQAHYHQGRRVDRPTPFWRQAETSFKTALQVLQPPQFEELHLEVVQDLVRVLLDLHETAEAAELQRRGTDLLRRMLVDPKRSDRQKRSIALQFAGFEQLTVDLALQSGDIGGAWELAETGKNTCLRWLLGTEEVPDVGVDAIPALLTEDTAMLYWHLSPIALTTFLWLPGRATPLVIPPPDHLPSESGAFSALTTEVDGRSLSLRQLLAWEAWLNDWNQQYGDYSSPKDKTAGTERPRMEHHSWREGMGTRLAALSAILHGAAIARHLQANAITQLILIPHRDLHRFPLHWLLADYTCRYLPSAQVGLALQQRQLARLPLQSLLLVENPKHSSGMGDKLKPLANLPFAEVEAALVWHLLTEQAGNGASHILSNDQQAATRDTLKTHLSEPHQVLHFTGHGAYHSLNPAQSCLFLSGSDRLTLLDIVPLDLSAYRLVGLAACETAVTGDQTISDEYVGLVSAFLKAQVGGVVSTLWRVESAASAILMVQFYRELQQGQPPILALKAAQAFLQTATRADLVQWLEWAMPKLPRSLRLILESQRDLVTMMTTEQPYNHPYYWAAFTLAGL